MDYWNYPSTILKCSGGYAHTLQAVDNDKKVRHNQVVRSTKTQEPRNAHHSWQFTADFCIPASRAGFHWFLNIFCQLKAGKFGQTETLSISSIREIYLGSECGIYTYRNSIDTVQMPSYIIQPPNKIWKRPKQF